MSIGLYDEDFFKYNQVMFNLEIMKMATYYKNKREITILAPSFSPERYTEFYLRKDIYDGTFPSGMGKYNNLTYGGLAFTNQRYIPMKEEIEIQIPDNYIYEPYKKLFLDGTKSKKAAFTQLIRNTHLRLSLDEKTVWGDFEKQIRRGSKSNILFFHDSALHKLEGVREAIPYLLSKYSSSSKRPAILGTKFPIVCTGAEDFLFWNQFRFNQNFLLIRIEKRLPDEELINIVSSASQGSLSRIEYQIGPASSLTDDFIMNELPKIFKQVIFCCTQQKEILLTIDKNFPIEEEWTRLIFLFNLYMRAATTYVGVMPTLHKFCKQFKPRKYINHKNLMCREEVVDLFRFAMENHYELFKMFYECNKVRLEGGELVCH